MSSESEYFARKISLPKWSSRDTVRKDITKIVRNDRPIIRADAITCCLKTNQDTLSTWKCMHNKTDVSNVVIALAPTMSRIDKIHIILLDKQELDRNDISLRNTPSSNRDIQQDIALRHTDIIELDLHRLTCIAYYIADLVVKGINYYTFIKNEVKEIVRTAIETERLDINCLQTKVQEEINTEINKVNRCK